MAFNHWCSHRSKVDDCFCDKTGRFQSDEREETCPHTNEPTKRIGETVTGKIGQLLSPEAIQASARKRSLKDFKENVFPTIPEDHKGYFREKHGIKK